MDIEELYGEGMHPSGWYCKGHVDPQEFLDKAVEMWDWPAATWVKETPSVEYVSHEWWRCIPDLDEGGVRFHPAIPGKRGAFAVTVLEWR